MTKNNLKNLTRAELLELLLDQTKHANELQAEVDELKEKLKSREITNITGKGTLADAALQLNGIFEAADKAAKQYLENIRGSDENGNEIMDDAIARSNEMLRQTYEYCEELARNAEQKYGVNPLPAEPQPVQQAAPQYWPAPVQQPLQPANSLEEFIM